jgi:F0F1-type ATP synthase membrane subunit b/b'
MERISEELEKIEKEAKYIRSEALKKSEEIVAIAQKKAAKLVSDSRRDAEAETEELLNKYVKEANEEREDALKKSEESIKELTITSKKGINKAGKTIFDAVLGDLKV